MTLAQSIQNEANTIALLGQALNRPSREYVEAVELLELHADWMTDRDGVEVQVINVTTAADLIADHYERRES